MVGTGVGARHGVLIKGGAALETAHGVQAVVFDKTGTLTKGEPSVVRAEVFHAPSCLSGPLGGAVALEAQLLWLAASCEAQSEHPLAKALLAAVSRPLAQAAAFESAASCGVRASLRAPWSALAGFEAAASAGSAGAGREQSGLPLEVAVGTRAMMEGLGCRLTAPQEARARKAEADGCTVLFLHLSVPLGDGEPNGFSPACASASAGGYLAGCVAVADTVRPEAAAVVSHLKSMGLQVWMASGDNSRTANAIARQVGISNVMAELKP
jgi:Cu+-exporting ATPase